MSIITVKSTFCKINSEALLIPNISILVQQKDLGPLMEPEPIQFSFNTPGWYIVGALLILLFLFIIYRRVKLYRRNAYRREALKEIKELNNSGSKTELSQELCTLMMILKLVALKAYGRQKVATLHGRSWLEFLESKSRNTSFKQFEKVISGAIYQNKAPDANELTKLKGLSKKWIQNHA